VTWGFIWIMLALKIPLIALILIVWWAIRQKPEEEPPASDDDGGLKRRHHPREPRPFPRNPRRGPHGGLLPSSPSRIRTVRAKARTLGH
jgi:hypothetical protein